jgi:Pvc16 N-terminal domain
MSSALALAAVTTALQTGLQFLYNGSVLGTVNVAAIAPDLVESTYGIGTDSNPVVNLFLHQVTPNAAWRNIGLPSLAADGATRRKNPPLALDLHYLLTAYASENSQAEALLGYAVLMLHENPILPRAVITDLLATLSSNTYNNALKDAGVSAQIEMIKIAPATLGREEMAWLWTALKADYRPTFPFQASVVLMRNDNPEAYSLPVLTRNIVVQAGGVAQLLAVQPPYDQSPIVAGDTVEITGISLNGASAIVLTNPVTNVSYQFAPAINGLTNTLLSFKVPDVPAQMPCGVCQVNLQFMDPSGNLTQQTNSVVIGVGISIAGTPAPTAGTSGGGTLITLSCDPQVQTQQQVSLSLFAKTGGTSQGAPAQNFTGPAALLSFQFPSVLPAGTYSAYLVVDGVVTPVAQNWSFTPPNTLTVMP